MEELIKSLILTLEKIKDETQKISSKASAIKQELIKTKSNGQWELLEKAIWEHAPHIRPQNCKCSGATKGDNMHHYSCVDANGGIDINSDINSANRKIFSDKLRDLFKKMNDHIIAGNQLHAHRTNQEILDHIRTTPTDHFDLGTLGNERENHSRMAKSVGIPSIFNKGLLRQTVKDKLYDAQSLKDIHDKHGGIDAIKGLIRAEGANGVPEQYAQGEGHDYFSKPGLRQHVLDIIGSGKGDYDRQENPHFISSPYTGSSSRWTPDEQKGSAMHLIKWRPMAFPTKI
jgi:hypothetical protein